MKTYIFKVTKVESEIGMMDLTRKPDWDDAGRPLEPSKLLNWDWKNFLVFCNGKKLIFDYANNINSDFRDCFLDNLERNLFKWNAPVREGDCFQFVVFNNYPKIY